MTSILVPPQPKAQQSRVDLVGVQWTTFQSLVAELMPDTDLTLTYGGEGLSVSQKFVDAEQPVTHVCLRGLSWQMYQALVNDVGDGRAWRIAYSQGVLEIRMPLTEHEEPKEILGDFVTVMVELLDLELRKLGALRLDRADLTKAIEPDACFYVQNEPQVRGKSIQLPADPPPDLAIESDYTNSSLNKQDIYAAIGVPELWRYRRQQLEVYILTEAGTYQRADQSLTFPLFPAAEIPAFIDLCKEIGQRKAVKAFRARMQSLITESN
ncbi:MAG: Uma2 family endonuclease [Cyanobacteria bacterium J06628_6]